MTAIDPCCGMKVDEKEAEKKGLFLEKTGETWYFCNKNCKEKFEIKSSYIPVKCGTCMKECSLKETIWKIKREGKLYCFCSQKCKEEFKKQP